jgi:hypothetical protein
VLENGIAITAKLEVTGSIWKTPIVLEVTLNKMSDILCRQCGKPITFDAKHISQRSGKKIPLDKATNEPHDCQARRGQPQRPQQQQHQQQQRQYLQCSRDCGNEIYFDVNKNRIPVY